MSRGVLMIGDLRRHHFDNTRTAYVRSQFLERVGACLGDKVVLYQSRSTRYGAGYFAVATLLDADVAIHKPGYISLIFGKPVYFRNMEAVHASGHIIESWTPAKTLAPLLRS
jgi:hypothetical protein